MALTELEKQQRHANILFARFHDLLISQKFAQQQIGFIHTLDIQYGEPLPARTLLEVEEIAKQKREKRESINYQYIAEINNQLHSQIQAKIDAALQDIDYVYHEIIQIQDNIPAILDILAVRSASVGRIDPLIKDLPWLGDEILKLVNAPQYRQEKDQKKLVKVDNPSLGLRYLGLDNLKFALPTFALKRWTPYSTAPFELLKRKLWETGMACAIASKTVAEIHNIDPFHSFVLGMFHDVGKLALVRMYLRYFESLWQKNVTEARDNLEKDRHEALVKLAPDPLYLRNLMADSSDQLSLALIKKMSFKYLPITFAMEEIAEKIAMTKASPLTQSVLKGRAYSHYKFLQKHVLIESDEAKALFKHHHFSPLELKTLATVGLTNLQLRIEC